MSSNSRLTLTVALMATAMLASASFAAEPPPPPPGTTQVGLLRCELAPTIGFLIGSHQRMNCIFHPTAGGPDQHYVGAINTVGLDIGISAGGALAWGVFAPTSGAPAGGLAGIYVGATGEVGVGVGVGANILFGGSNRTIALQPLSLEGEVGVNLAVGMSGLELRAAPY